jgi:hypothetical protein
MAHEAMNNASMTPAAAGPPDQVVSSERRSFLKETALVAGAAVVGGWASAVPPTAVAQTRETHEAPEPRHPVTGVHIHFNQQKQPTLDDVMKAIQVALRPTGCTTCGLAGIDLRLGLQSIINPQGEPNPSPWIITKQAMSSGQ